MPLLSILPRMLIFDFENKLFSCAKLLIELTSCFIFCYVDLTNEMYLNLTKNIQTVDTVRPSKAQ